MADPGSLATVAWDAKFRHSSGTLGTRFFRALRDEQRLLGWRSGGRVLTPPRETGLPGEWVDIGPGAKLAAYCPAEWATADASDQSVLALVEPDGADTPLLARLKAGAATPSVGMRLSIRFADARVGAMSDFWFEPVR